MSASQKPQTLVIFDVDGTLLDANAIDNDCFDRAFREVTGVALTESIWSGFKEVTARAIIQQALGPDRPDISSIEDRIRDTFLANLRASHRDSPERIRGFPGAIELLTTLKKRPDLGIAIATGCWRETAHFKLGVAGFDFTNIPFASSSDHYRRADIISLAAKRAGHPIEDSVYIGDGLWDYRATQELGIPFIGFGRKIEALREAGIRYPLTGWNENVLLEILGQLP